MGIRRIRRARPAGALGVAVALATVLAVVALATVLAACSGGSSAGPASAVSLAGDDQVVATAIATAIDAGPYGLTQDQERCIGTNVVHTLGAALVKEVGLDTDRPSTLTAKDATAVAGIVERCADLREHIAFIVLGGQLRAENVACLSAKVSTDDVHKWLVNGFEGTSDLPSALTDKLTKAVDGCNESPATATPELVIDAVRRAYSTDPWGFTGTETRCISEKLVNLFGVTRARALQLDNINAPIFGATEAGVVADVLFGCADMKAAAVFAYFDGQLTHPQSKCVAAVISDDEARRVVIGDLQGQQNQNSPLVTDLDAKMIKQVDACKK